MIKVIAKLGDIPESATVTKIRGEKMYKVRRSIRIFSDQGPGVPPKEIECDSGFSFLVSQDYEHISMYSSDKEFVWYTSPRELLGYVEEDDD